MEQPLKALEATTLEATTLETTTQILKRKLGICFSFFCFYDIGYSFGFPSLICYGAQG